MRMRVGDGTKKLKLLNSDLSLPLSLPLSPSLPLFIFSPVMIRSDPEEKYFTNRPMRGL